MILSDRFYEFVNDDPTLREDLERFRVSRSAFFDKAEFNYIKDITFNEFRKSILKLLDTTFVKHYRKEAADGPQQNTLDNLVCNRLYMLTIEGLLEVIEDLADSIKTEYVPEDKMHVVEMSSALKYFPNAEFFFGFAYYEDHGAVDCEVSLTFDGIPYCFDSSEPYQSILYKIDDVFAKLAEDKYRYGNIWEEE